MNAGIQKKDFDSLCDLYEHRVLKFFQLVENHLDAAKKVAETYSSFLIEIELKVREHEKRRRRVLLDQATKVIKQHVSDAESIIQEHQTSVLNVLFDEDTFFEKLRSEISPAGNSISQMKKLLRTLLSTKVDRDKLIDLYSTIYCWASPDHINNESDKKIKEIERSTQDLIEFISNEMFFQYSKIIDPLQDSILLICTDSCSIEDVINKQKEINAEFDKLLKSTEKCNYTVKNSGDSITIRCNKTNNEIKFLASPIMGNIIPDYPYPKGAFEEIMNNCFPSSLMISANQKIELEQKAKNCKYIYPISIYDNCFVVQSPYCVTNGSTESKINYTIDDSVLYIDGFEQYDYDDIVFVSCSEKAICCLEEIEQYPQAKVALYIRNQAASHSFTIPLDMGEHNITIFGVSNSGTEVFRLPYKFVGERMILKYTVDSSPVSRLKSLFSNKTQLSFHFQIDSNYVFEKIANNKLPTMVVCIGNPEPLTKEDGETIYEIPFVELSNTASGGYAASIDVSLPRTDLSGYTVKVFFKETNKIFQLRDVRRVK